MCLPPFYKLESALQMSEWDGRQDRKWPVKRMPGNWYGTEPVAPPRDAHQRCLHTTESTQTKAEISHLDNTSTVIIAV